MKALTAVNALDAALDALGLIREESAQYDNGFCEFADGYISRFLCVQVREPG